MKSIIILSTLLVFGNSVEIKRADIANKSTLSEITCTAGSYVNGGSCTLCASGKYSKTDNAVECKNCEKGSWVTKTGQSSCNICIAGNKVVGFDENYTGGKGWTGCGINKYSEAGATICTSCETGKYAPLTGLTTNGPTACLDCEAGSYGLGVALGCKQCAAGTYSSSPRSSQCLPCPAGYFSSAGASVCSKCPAGYSTNEVGSSECISCASGNCNVLQSQYLGCYKDDPNRDVRNYAGYINVMTECQNLCKGYSYFSIQKRNQCFCGNAYATAVQYTKLSESVCSYRMPSNGGANYDFSAGGDYYINSVYRNVNYGGPDNVPVTVLVPDVPVEPHSQVDISQYLGCFIDDDKRDVRNYHGKAFTDVAQCQDKCDGFLYFSIQNGGDCYCGNSYANHSYNKKVEDSECSWQNYGRTLYWGGTWRNAVYRRAVA